MFSSILKIFKIGLLLAIVAVLGTIFWLPWVPRLAKENPETFALLEIRKNQAMKKKKEEEREKVSEEVSMENED